MWVPVGRTSLALQEVSARRDPVWDLGFLIGADGNLADEGVEAVIAGYAAGATVDRDRLM